MHSESQFVTADDLASLLSALEALPGPERDGFFGPSSITWQVNRESAVFLGAGRAALLQLAHPWVAAALEQHSSLMHDAIGRFHSTFRVVYTMLFGTRSQALIASRRLYRLHSTIRGDVPSPAHAPTMCEHYEANDVAALRWVFATLVESAMLAYDLVLSPLPHAARETYYLESQRMAALCGIPSQSVPATWEGLTQYTAGMMASPLLTVGASARTMGQAVLSGVGTWVRVPHWYRALTASWLPVRLQQGFALPFAEDEAQALQRAKAWLPKVYPRLPSPVRFVGPFHEAQARLRGRRVGFWTQQNNRFWMGLPELLYADGDVALR